MQYMCDDGPFSTNIRNGNTTNTIPTDATDPNINQYGQHENHLWYNQCKVRQRNNGLYLADQNLQGTTAIYTRQNAAGTRHGLECTEERDYYPYWHPTPWRDIWVCTDTPSQCPDYQEKSQNVMNYGSCSDPQYNNQKDCQYNKQTWTFSGANNHNGNADGQTSSPNFMWQIPFGLHADGAKCIIRLRYNVSTYDFTDHFNTFASSNGPNSVLRTNPTSDFVGLGANVTGPLRLNVNTAQFGRTFEDRTHVFQIRKRPANLTCGIRKGNDCKIVNLNVRGRRGNIQQTYPAVEYDFVPPVVKIGKNDFLHIQWTGSDANNQNNAGNGRTGTDRSNIVVIGGLGKNKPLNLDPLTQTNKTALHFTNNNDLIAKMAFLDQTACDDQTTDTNDNNNCKTLNRAPAYVNVGLVQMDNVGTFHYMSTRNNAFTNREQKATIVVSEDHFTNLTIAGIAVVGSGLLAAFGLFGFRMVKKKQIESQGALSRAGSVDELANGSTVDLLTTPAKSNWAEKHPYLSKIHEWYLWNEPRMLFGAFYVSCVAGAGLYGYLMHLEGDHPPYFPFAKMFGLILDFNLSFILIPVLRNFLSFLRTTPVSEKLPLDDNITIHKWVGYTIGISAVGHITMHFLDFYYLQQYRAIPFYVSALFNLPGPTGFIATTLFAAMFSTAFLKRKIYRVLGFRFDGYKIFLKLHKLWMPAYAILWIHGSRFWQFSIFPIMFMALEKFIMARRSKVDVKIIEAKMVGKDVLGLKMQLVNGNKKFRYKAGQYLFLCCPDINESEYHPFTITSAPEENFFSCHIRCRMDMDWTYRLRQILGHAPPRGDEKIPLAAPAPTNDGPMYQAVTVEPTPIVLRVDGPFGSASEEVFDYETVLLVGAGIGVTPFISILKSIAMRIRGNNSAIEPTSMQIYFYWICRDQMEFDSFKDFFDQILTISELATRLELNMYVTGEVNLKDVKAQAYNQFAGRPNWNRIFKEKATKHKGSEIGVFLCGPAPVAQELSAASKRYSSKLSKGVTVKTKGATISNKDKPTLFKFHKENF
ncbi:hypothetical protein HDV02_004911 [Globomyces sp. JEL0801]|nr:hypothetical protein HDV02_004911 [Globomyces sp. JEL0801]